MDIQILFEIATGEFRIQKKSSLHGCEPEEGLLVNAISEEGSFAFIGNLEKCRLSSREQLFYYIF